MKKYIVNIFTLVVFFAACALSACQEYEPFTDHDLKTLSYEKDFVSIFGKPDPNHQWGFVNQPMMEIPFDATRGNDTDKNHWYANYHANLNIPGYPDHLHHLSIRLHSLITSLSITIITMPIIQLVPSLFLSM